MILHLGSGVLATNSGSTLVELVLVVGVRVRVGSLSLLLFEEIGVADGGQGGGLVDDRSLVNLLVNGGGVVDSGGLNSFSLNDGLD